MKENLDMFFLSFTQDGVNDKLLEAAVPPTPVFAGSVLVKEWHCLQPGDRTSGVHGLQEGKPTALH